MSSYQYRKSHCGDKTLLWLFYLHNGISYTDNEIENQNANILLQENAFENANSKMAVIWFSNVSLFTLWLIEMW